MNTWIALNFLKISHCILLYDHFVCVTSIKWVWWLVVEYEAGADSSHGLNALLCAFSVTSWHAAAMYPIQEQEELSCSIRMRIAPILAYLSLKHPQVLFSTTTTKKMIPVRCRGQLEYNKLHSLLYRSGWALKMGLNSSVCFALPSSLIFTVQLIGCWIITIF